MSKKHFIELGNTMRLAGAMPAAISRCLANQGIEPYGSTRDALLASIANELADFCQSQNSRFNRERWIGYININGR